MARSDRHDLASGRHAPPRTPPYDRARALPRLLPLAHDLLEATDAATHARLLAALRRALRIERQRGIAGDWCYDLGRHTALLAAYRAELALSRTMSTARSPARRLRPRRELGDTRAV